MAARVGGLLADIAVLLFQLFVTLIALFFFLRDADTIMRDVRGLLPFEELRRERMIRQTRDLVYASIAAGLVIAALQGLAGGLVFALLGLGAPVFWGVMMGLLALLPFVGTWVVWMPAAIWLIATGQVVKGVVLVVLGGTIVASIDNVLRPAILSGRAQMNGLLMFHQSAWWREPVWLARHRPGPARQRDCHRIVRGLHRARRTDQRKCDVERGLKRTAAQPWATI